MDEKTLRQIEQIIDYQFNDRTLLRKAFVHASAADNRSLSNERLEFLGDSVLALAVCQKLFEEYPDHLEGGLTKMKSMIVSRKLCAKVAKKLSLHKFLLVGKGMAQSRALTGSVAAGLLEAVIAAVYIDGGYGAAEKFVLESFSDVIKKAESEIAQGNFKSILQQYAQQQLSTVPNYELLDEKGPEHSKCFEVRAVVLDKSYESAWGANKKDAEQKAAHNALVEIGVLNPK
ncbi:ribonuclease III [Planctomycetota bacterium]